MDGDDDERDGGIEMTEEERRIQEEENAKAKAIRDQKAKEDKEVESRRNIYLFSPFKSNKVTCQIQELSHGMIL